MWGRDPYQKVQMRKRHLRSHSLQRQHQSKWQQPILCFHCDAVKNKNANQSIQNVQKWKRITLMYKKPRQESGLRDNSYARYSGKRFTQIYKALYGDAMLVTLWGAQIWPPETNRNICFWVFLLVHEFIAWGTHKD